MGAVAIQTQCCMQQRDDCETDEEEDAPKEMCLGTVAAALLARLLAARPRCPGASRKQPASPARTSVQMDVN